MTSCRLVSGQKARNEMTKHGFLITTRAELTAGRGSRGRRSRDLTDVEDIFHGAQTVFENVKHAHPDMGDMSFVL